MGAPAFPWAKFPISIGLSDEAEVVFSSLLVPFSRASSSARSSGKGIPYIPPDGVNYISKLDLNEPNEKFEDSFKYDSTNFENAGWAQVTVTNGASDDQLIVTIIGYKTDGTTVLSTTKSTLNKKRDISLKK